MRPRPRTLISTVSSRGSRRAVRISPSTTWCWAARSRRVWSVTRRA